VLTRASAAGRTPTSRAPWVAAPPAVAPGASACGVVVFGVTSAPAVSRGAKPCTPAIPESSSGSRCSAWGETTDASPGSSSQAACRTCRWPSQESVAPRINRAWEPSPTPRKRIITATAKAMTAPVSRLRPRLRQRLRQACTKSGIRSSAS